MKTSQELANLIKETAKFKHITIGKMLSDCNLSVNTLSSMQSGGYYPRLEAISKIADYLDCSVDYLLGRTDNPNINDTNNNIKTENNANIQLNQDDLEILNLIEKLPLKKRVKFISMLYHELDEK